MVELRLEGLNCAGCAQKIQGLVSNLKDVEKATVNLALEKIEIETLPNADRQAIEAETNKIVTELEPHVKVYPFKQSLSHTFYLNGLHCASCSVKIEDALKKHEKMNDVSFSFATKKLKVTSDVEKNKLQAIIQVTVDRIESGVSVDLSENNNTITLEVPSDTKQGTVNDKPTPKWLLFLKKHSKTMLGTILLAILVLNEFPANAELFGFFTAYILIGGDVAYRAFRNIARGQLFDENFLMTLATIGAFALGENIEAVAVMLFYKVGEGFQDYAVERSRESITSLLNIKAEYANLVLGDTTKKVIPDALSINDVILIKAGEKVPVDGIVIDGITSLDTSALTGESLPRTTSKGDEILSGSINIDATVTVKVTRTFENSTVSKILDMVENATSKKAKTEQFITKFARVYTPIVVVAAALLGFLPPLLGLGSFSEWISRALIFLVISCPCALVLSVPLGFFGGLGAASRQGILIKGGNYLEALNTIDTFVFDKTGTLTKGNFAVVDVTGEKTLQLAAMLEQHSNHPIAQSILQANDKEVSLSMVDDVKEIAGEGLSGRYLEQTLVVGNSRIMKRFGINMPDSAFHGTIVHVALDNNYIGAIHIADEIKENVKNLSKELKNLGAKEIVMLTGDQKSIADEVASTLNIDTVYSELLPQDKMKHVEAMIDKGQKVLFVGDGINDAPVLARADLGVAMGGLGSDAAVEAADIVLMTDEPHKIIAAKSIAKKTRRIVMQNIVFALGIKVFFLALGAAGEASMYEAIFADVGVALLAVLNATRVLRIKD